MSLLLPADSTKMLRHVKHFCPILVAKYSRPRQAALRGVVCVENWYFSDWTGCLVTQLHVN
jgi:hypothetical protein